MNESMSILLATSILALGGLGLYMYKSADDDNQKDGDNEYDENNLFGSNFWGTTDKDDEKIEEDLEEFKPRKRVGGKTQKNKKLTGSSRRRY